MESRNILFGLGAILVAALALPLVAQVRQKIPEPEVKRETVIDEDGYQQWAKYDEKCPNCGGFREKKCEWCDRDTPIPDCVECDGTKKAPCRICGGKGRLPDPLVDLRCIYCSGSSWYPCGVCGGGGSITVTDQNGNKESRACGSCKKKGFFPCTVCEQTRRLPVIKVKRKPPGEAKLKDLKALRDEMKAALLALQEWEPQGRASKAYDSLEKLMKKPGKKLPALKDMLELLETVQKGLTKSGSGFVSYESNQTHQFHVFKDRSVYLLQHQTKVLDLCVERAEFNEKVKSGGK